MCTDSESTVKAIKFEKFKYLKQNKLYNLVEKQQEQGKQLTLWKVAAFTEIMGNGMVDKAAKEATTMVLYHKQY